MPDEAFLLGMPGRLRDGAMTVKVVTVFESHDPSHLATIGLYDPRTGACRAFMDGTYITAIRTSAAAAVATDLLAREDAKTLAIIGAGVQGEHHLRTFPLVRDFDEIRISSLYAEDAHRLAALHPRAHAVDDPEAAVRGADVVALATHAAQPVIEPAWIAPGHARQLGRLPPAGRGAPPRAARPRDAVRRDAGSVRAHAGRLRGARTPPGPRPSWARSCSAAGRAAPPTTRSPSTRRWATSSRTSSPPSWSTPRPSKPVQEGWSSCRVGGCAGHSPSACSRPSSTPASAEAHDSLAPLGRLAQLAARGGVGRPPLGPVRRAGAEGRARLGGARPARLPLQRPPHARRADRDPQALADRLVAPWQGISDAHRALLRERTLRILTQGHLAQHMFFHVFHGAALHTASNELLGTDAATYRHHREEQLSYVEIARRGGVPAERLRPACRPCSNSTGEKGSSASSPGRRRPAGCSRARNAWVDCWLRSPPPGDDPANPYGKNRFLHGAHAVDWPATAAQRRTDDLRVDRFRRALPKSCWPIPPRWSP